MQRLEPIVRASMDFATTIGGWPWHAIGVFPALVHVEEGSARADSGFLYTVGLDPTYEVWMPNHSIEGRGIDYQFAGSLLNGIAFATKDATLRPGDNALAAVGIPGPNWPDDPDDFYDADAVFWIGQMEPAGRRQTFQSTAPRTLPVLWSSPLGWKEEDDDEDRG